MDPTEITRISLIETVGSGVKLQARGEIRKQNASSPLAPRTLNGKICIYLKQRGEMYTDSNIIAVGRLHLKA
jgi:hypothetical protein